MRKGGSCPAALILYFFRVFSKPTFELVSRSALGLFLKVLAPTMEATSEKIAPRLRLGASLVALFFRLPKKVLLSKVSESFLDPADLREPGSPPGQT